jgi:hypothetical protein
LPQHSPSTPAGQPPERREGPDRRRETWRALLYGSLRPRRLGPRRGLDRSIAAVDWHNPQWLAVALLILLLSCTDAVLTITLLQLGAYEANPFMAPLVKGSGLAFALVKLGLTGGGIILLTIVARLRAFGWLPAGWFLYAILAGYVVLIGYELWLLELLLLENT